MSNNVSLLYNLNIYNRDLVMYCETMEELREIDYVDTFSQACPEDLTAAQAVSAIFSSTPSWITRLLKLRNALVSSTGLKTGFVDCPIDSSLIKENTSLGLLKIGKVTDHYALLGTDDKHLNFRVIITTNDSILTCTTQVHFNNAYGKTYFFFVKPFHRFIVPAMIRAGLKGFGG